MEWLKSNFTKSGYSVLANAPEDGKETPCLKKEVIELKYHESPPDDTWTYKPTTTSDDNKAHMGYNFPLYVKPGYVENGYYEGDTPVEMIYGEQGYSEAGYFEGDGKYQRVVYLWMRWVSDPVKYPYVRDGYFDEETNPTPCVPYTLKPDMLDDIYGLYPFGNVVPAVLMNKNISHVFGLKMPFEDRKELGETAYTQQG